MPITRSRTFRIAAALLTAVTFMPLIGSADAQQGARDTTATRDTLAHGVTVMDAVLVTGTLNPTEVFSAAQPSAVIGSRTLSLLSPNSIADVLRTMPGLTVTGVGASHVRPVIRGQQGQRILLLDDGVRLNNSRRQQDFGETPALSELGQIERAEVVRGPASVLYGTDAIGGVINLFPIVPTDGGLTGTVGYRYSSADAQRRVKGNVSGRVGDFGFMFGMTRRNADAYESPRGSFGGISLDDNTRVFDTGVEDDAFDGFVSYSPGAAHTFTARYRRYRSDNAGFGFVDPDLYDVGAPRIRITYPEQSFDKLTLGYEALLNRSIIDQLSVRLYGQENTRRLNLDIFVPFGPSAPPGSGVTSDARNYTDMNTVGGRLEAKRFIAGRHILTFGADYFRDRSSGWDTTVTVVTGFGPPSTSVSGKANVPDGSYQSYGLFAQGEIKPFERTVAILGTRFQNVETRTANSADVDQPINVSDNTVVGAANVIYTLTSELNLIGAVGSAFRSPNLVERLFTGVVTNGSAYQIPNSDLRPETSLNYDLGVRFRNALLSAEAFLFRNDIRNGIRTVANGDTVSNLPVYTNVNVDKLRFSGVELAAELFLPHGFSVGGTLTSMESRNVLDPEIPVGETFSTNMAGTLNYTQPRGDIWLSYEVRHNGERKDVLLGSSPIGDVLPAFTIHSVRASGVLFRTGWYTQRVGVSVINLTNELYAEFSNASFFRPEPRRSFVLSFDAIF